MEGVTSTRCKSFHTANVTSSDSSDVLEMQAVCSFQTLVLRYQAARCRVRRVTAVRTLYVVRVILLYYTGIQ